MDTNAQSNARGMPFTLVSVIYWDSGNGIGCLLHTVSVRLITFTLLNYSAPSATVQKLGLSTQRGTVRGRIVLIKHFAQRQWTRER